MQRRMRWRPLLEALRDLRVAEIVKQDMTVENGKVAAYRARVLVSFKCGS